MTNAANIMECWGLTADVTVSADRFPGCTAGRIIGQEKGFYRAVCAGGVVRAAVSGKFRHEVKTALEYPAVGDFVLLSTGCGNGPATIHALLPRKSVFIRRAAGSELREQVVAANVDVVFLCMALNSDFNLRRLERYLSIAWESGAQPVVLLTKADLCSDLAGKAADAAGVAAGAELLISSSIEQGGVNAVLPYLQPGRTVALIGSSGVGKSTLINRLLGTEALQTNGLRRDGRGRHTTTRRELLMLPRGGLVIDTPGMRELGLWDAANGLSRTFEDIEALAARCRFKDCTHANQPGCAICEALANGTLTQERWLSYQKLASENAYLDNRLRYLAAKQQKFKTIAQYNKTNRKK